MCVGKEIKQKARNELQRDEGRRKDSRPSVHAAYLFRI
jgi:hypothetical protein